MRLGYGHEVTNYAGAFQQIMLLVLLLLLKTAKMMMMNEGASMAHFALRNRL